MANIHVYVYGITKLQSVYVYVYTRPKKAREYTYMCMKRVYTSQHWTLPIHQISAKSVFATKS